MGYNAVFTSEAIKDLDGLDKKALLRIIKKIKWFVKQDNPLVFAKRLQYDAIGQYRFRIGDYMASPYNLIRSQKEILSFCLTHFDYRVIFDCKEKDVIVLRVGHRSIIYK